MLVHIRLFAISYGKGKREDNGGFILLFEQPPSYSGQLYITNDNRENKKFHPSSFSIHVNSYF
ncbi:MAG TPA: hypothetical protein VIK89_05915 [Cytophagaceae bacterium]